MVSMLADCILLSISDIVCKRNKSINTIWLMLREIWYRKRVSHADKEKANGGQRRIVIGGSREQTMRERVVCPHPPHFNNFITYVQCAMKEILIYIWSVFPKLCLAGTHPSPNAIR